MPTVHANAEIFEKLPPAKAILAQALPTIAAQVITVVYAVVDIFFVGQLGDPSQVAAVRLAFPPLLFLVALGNLFGIGASSMIGRSLGEGNTERASRCAALAFWAGCSVTLLYVLLIRTFEDTLLPFLGTTPETWGFTRKYLNWVVCIGGLPSVMSMTFAHLLRSEGHAKVAGKGIALGGLVNVLLAPVFIFALHMEVEGAGVAIVISNLVSAGTLYGFIRKNRTSSVVRLSPRLALEGLRYAPEIALVGLASFVLTSMATVSNGAINTLSSPYGSAAVAALGIAKQIDQLIFSCSIGLAQGTLPLIAYNFSSGNHERLRAIVKVAVTGGMALSAAASLILMLLAGPIASAFMSEAKTAAYTTDFLRIIALACPVSIAGHFVISGFQACGAKWRPLFCAFLRKGSLDFLLMIVLSSFLGLYGVAWGLTLAEYVSAAVSLTLFIPFVMKLKTGEAGHGGHKSP